MILLGSYHDFVKRIKSDVKFEVLMMSLLDWLHLQVIALVKVCLQKLIAQVS